MEVHVIPVNDSPHVDKFIVYRPRVGVAFVSNRAMAKLAQSLAAEESRPPLRPDIESFLQSVGFFQPDPPAPPPMNRDFRPNTAVLLMTNQCQLRCTYCYAAAGEFVPQNLTIETARNVIDYVCQSAIDQGAPRFEVSFHGGGEPTFNWKVLQEATAYARQKPYPSRLTLTSNGVWSLRQQEWILNNLDSLSISMDGGPQTQDRQRPFASGRGSSAHVLRSIAALDARQFDYGIRLTGTAPWTHIPEDVRFICEHTGCRLMQVEPAFNTKRGGHGWPDDNEVQGFAEAYLEAAEIAQRHNRYLQFSGARLGTITSTFCTAPFNALIVNGSGQLVSCYEVASEAHALSQLSIVGRVENGQVQVDFDARNRLHNMMEERRATCEGCFCYWSCAGDCYARAFSTQPGGHLFHSGRCALARSVTREMLIRRIAEGGGVWRMTNQYVAAHIGDPEPIHAPAN